MPMRATKCSVEEPHFTRLIAPRIGWLVTRPLTTLAADAYLASMWRSSFGGAVVITLAIPFVIVFGLGAIGCREGRQLVADPGDGGAADRADAGQGGSRGAGGGAAGMTATGGKGGTSGAGGTGGTGGSHRDGGSDGDATSTAGALMVSPATHTFDDTPQDATSASQAFFVTNDGGSPAGTTSPLAVVLGGDNPNDFTIAANSCAGLGGFNAGSSCGFSVAFKPASGGKKNATVTVSADPGGTAVASVTGNALGPAVLTLAPAAGSSANFGSQNIGQSTPEDFTLTNSGQLASSAISLTLTVLGGSGFSIAGPSLGDCASGVTTLAPGASCNIEVRFTPTSTGGAAATLGASASMGAMASLLLSATGTIAPSFTPSSTAVDLGNVPIGTAGMGSVSFTNMGTSATGVPTVSLASNGTPNQLVIVSNGCVTALGAGSSCSVSFTLTPTVAGIRTDYLRISASPGGTVLVGVSVTGV